MSTAVSERQAALFTITDSGHIAIAKKMMESDLFLAWGTLPDNHPEKASRDNSAPFPNRFEADLIQEVGRRKILQKTYLEQHNDGPIVTPIASYRQTTTPTRTLMLSVTNEVTDAPNAKIYQLGVYADTVAQPAAKGKNWLLPDEIMDKGYLVVMANILPIQRNNATVESRQFIINF